MSWWIQQQPWYMQSSSIFVHLVCFLVHFKIYWSFWEDRRFLLKIIENINFPTIPTIFNEFQKCHKLFILLVKNSRKFITPTMVRHGRANCEKKGRGSFCVSIFQKSKPVKEFKIECYLFHPTNYPSMLFPGVSISKKNKTIW